MSRRYYALILEVDDTPEIERDGHVTVPGVPVVTSCKRIGLLRRLFHVLFTKKKKKEKCCHSAHEAIIEIPEHVDVSELFDFGDRGSVTCRVKKQQKCSCERLPEV